METSKLLNDLRAELNRIERAISALEQLDDAGGPVGTVPKAQPAQARGGRRMSAAGRKRISEAAKARWAARRKASATSAPDQTRVKARRGGGRKGGRKGRSSEA